MRRLSVLLLVVLLCACARGRVSTPPGCDSMYVILPDNYVVDLAAGAKVVLNPAVHEFALFCSPGDARVALDRAAPDGDWRIYRLGGSFGELARIRGNDYSLAQPAEITDWVQ